MGNPLTKPLQRETTDRTVGNPLIGNPLILRGRFFSGFPTDLEHISGLTTSDNRIRGPQCQARYQYLLQY